METLGAKLRRHCWRRAKDVRDSFRTEAEAYVPSKKELKLVEARWNSAKRVTRGLVRLNPGRNLSFLVGTLRQGTEVTEARDAAVLALTRSCLPLTVPEGIEDRENPFHAGWLAFCQWALSEELLPALELVHDSRVVQTELRLRITPLPAR